MKRGRRRRRRNRLSWRSGEGDEQGLLDIGVVADVDADVDVGVGVEVGEGSEWNGGFPCEGDNESQDVVDGCGRWCGSAETVHNLYLGGER